MKKAIPDITILMSTYNRRKYLPTVLRDLQAQTFSNWKLIIVNDGGDDVRDIVAEIGDKRIEYHNRQHIGKAAQLNYALSLVESKYIGYIDDDDRIMPEHYELLFKAAEINGVDFVYSDAQPVVLNYKDDSVITKWPVNDKDIEWQDIRIHNAINHSTVLHTKSLADKVGKYDERMQVLIDFDYIKRLTSFVKPFHVHATTYQWNIRQDELGRILTISGLWEREPEEAGRSLLAFFEKDPISLTTCYREHAELKQEVINLETVHKRNIQLEEQLISMQQQLEDQQVAYTSKGRKHIFVIRMLLWLCIVLFFMLVIMVLNV